jgi:hypothetical protein
VTIPNSVTSIGDFAFSQCNNLTGVAIGNGVTRINRAFLGCNSLIAITVDPNNPAYSSLGGVLFDNEQTTLVAFPPGRAGSYVLPNGVTSIGVYAFESCPKLTSVTMPNSVTAIGDYAFSGCTGLTGLTLSGSLTTIGSYAFSGCIGLTIVTFPSSLTTIGNYAFSGCSSFTGAYFQGNAPSLGGSNVFRGDNNLTVYYLPGTTGWGTTFGGRPTKLWNALIQTSGPSFGVRTNAFGFNIIGTTNIPILVEASTDLGEAKWTSLQSCTLTNGLIYFSDKTWINYPARYYRVRLPY